jgi:DNA polymerase III alpha subunit
MEDEHGHINVIVKPDIYQRDRSAVRMEPFLTVRGRLQKDGATLNVIAEEVQALRVAGTPRPGRPKSAESRPRSYASTRAERPIASAVVREGPEEASFRYLTALRQSPPGIKSFG